MSAAESAAALIGERATIVAEDLRWTEQDLLTAMSEPQDWCDLLDAAIRMVRSPDEDNRDALARRIIEIIPDGAS